MALGQGDEVRIGEFGNEGSGGQSYLVFLWQADTTYRFLTEVKPDGSGNTVYNVLVRREVVRAVATDCQFSASADGYTSARVSFVSREF